MKNLVIAMLQDAPPPNAPPDFMMLFMGLALGIGGPITTYGAYMDHDWVHGHGKSALLEQLLGRKVARVVQMTLGVLMGAIGATMVVKYFS